MNGLRGYTWISLRRGNRRDFVGELEADGNGIMRDEVGARPRGRILKETFNRKLLILSQTPRSEIILQKLY